MKLKPAKLSKRLAVFTYTAWTLFSSIGCDWLSKGSGKLTVIGRSLTPAPAVTTVKAGALAVGEGITSDLATNLVNAGLTADEAKVIVDSSKAEVNIAAGQIAIETLSLTETNPIIYVAAPAVRGAIKALDEPGANLPDVERRSLIAQVVMQSTVGSLGGRTTGLSTASILTLQKEMVGNGVKSLNDGGLGGDAAASAVKSLTTGAAASISKSIDQTTAAQAAASIVSGAVENLGSTGIPTDAILTLVGSAVEGVVTQLSKAGVSDASEAASLVAKSSVESLKVLDLPVEKVIQATEGAAKGAVSALTAAGVSKEAIAAAAQKVTESSASALKTAGVPEELVGKGAGAIASGAIQGLSAAGLSTQEISASKSISAIISGASSGIAKSITSSDKLTAALGDVAGNAITAITKLDTKKVDVSSLKDAIVSQVVQSTITAAVNAGVATSSTISYVAATIASGVGKGLATVAQAGVSVTTANSAIQSATQTALVQQKDKIGISEATITSVANQAAQTAEASKTLATSTANNASLADCAAKFPDSLTDDAFKTLLESIQSTTGTLPSCNLATVASCPKSRTYSKGTVSWLQVPGTNSCQFLLPDAFQSPTLATNCPSQASISIADVQAFHASPNDSSERACAKSPTAPCPALTDAAGNEAYGPWFYSSGTQTICNYKIPSTCADVFKGLTTVTTNTLITSPYSDEFGDIRCMIPATQTFCPFSSPGISSYGIGISRVLTSGNKMCQYSHIENTCPASLTITKDGVPSLVSSPVSFTTAQLTDPVKSSNILKLCKLSQVMPFPTVEATLAANGYFAAAAWGGDVSRLVIKSKTNSCPKLGSGTQLTLVDLDKLEMLENSGEKACEVDTVSSCPALAADAVLHFTVATRTYSSTASAPARKRCVFTPNSLPACPGSIPPSIMSSTLKQMSTYSSPVYMCQTASAYCPMAGANSELILNNPLRCVYGQLPGGTEKLAVTIDPPSGNFSQKILVSLAAPSGAAIYFTTDGSQPSASSTPYSTPLFLDASATIKAFAIKNGTSSSVSQASYSRIYSPDPVPGCSSAYANSLSDTDFRSSITPLYAVRLCSRDTASECPIARNYFDSGISFMISWIPIPGSSLCQFRVSTGEQNWIPPLCSTVLGGASTVGSTELPALPRDPRNPSQKICTKDPNPSTCPSKASNFTSMRSFITKIMGKDVCTYGDPIHCEDLFANTANRSASFLKSTNLANEFGDLRCSVASSASPTCPSLLSGSDEYDVTIDEPIGSRPICDYGHKESTCPSGIVQLDTDGNVLPITREVHSSDLANMSLPIYSYSTEKICQLSHPVNVAKVDASLAASGYFAQIRYDGDNPARLLIRNAAWPCPVNGSGSTINSSQIDFLESIEDRGEKACEVPITSSCPTITSDNSSSYTLRLDNSGAAHNSRCVYTRTNLSTCSATPFNLNSMTKLDEYGNIYLCAPPEGSNCPTPDSSATLTRSSNGSCAYLANQLNTMPTPVIVMTTTPGEDATWVNLSLDPSTNGVSLYVTNDGSTPDVSSFEYISAIPISVTSTLRVAAINKNTGYTLALASFSINNTPTESLQSCDYFSDSLSPTVFEAHVAMSPSGAKCLKSPLGSCPNRNTGDTYWESQGGNRCQFNDPRLIPSNDGSAECSLAYSDALTHGHFLTKIGSVDNPQKCYLQDSNEECPIPRFILSANTSYKLEWRPTSDASSSATSFCQMRRLYDSSADLPDSCPAYDPVQPTIPIQMLQRDFAIPHLRVCKKLSNAECPALSDPAVASKIISRYGNNICAYHDPMRCEKVFANSDYTNQIFSTNSQALNEFNDLTCTVNPTGDGCPAYYGNGDATYLTSLVDKQVDDRKVCQYTRREDLCPSGIEKTPSDTSLSATSHLITDFHTTYMRNAHGNLVCKLARPMLYPMLDPSDSNHASYIPTTEESIDGARLVLRQHVAECPPTTPLTNIQLGAMDLIPQRGQRACEVSSTSSCPAVGETDLLTAVTPETLNNSKKRCYYKYNLPECSPVDTSSLQILGEGGSTDISACSVASGGVCPDFSESGYSTLTKHLDADPSTCLYVQNPILASNCQALSDGGFRRSGLYLLNPFDPALDPAPSPIETYCDMSTDGGGWTLIGRGRENWDWTDGGLNTVNFSSGIGTPSAFEPAYFPATTVNAIIAYAPIDGLSQGVRLKRAESPSGLSYQEVRWKFADDTSWSWIFSNPATNSGLALSSVEINYTPLSSANQYEFNTYDSGSTHDDRTRIFTFLWGSPANSYTGFSYGMSPAVSESAAPANPFLLGREGGHHPIPYTEVYIRN